MIKNEDITRTGWPIPKEVKENFVNFCAAKGNLAQEDCAGALLLWIHLPAQLREWARVDAKRDDTSRNDTAGDDTAPEDFWRELQNRLLRSFDLLLGDETSTGKLKRTDFKQVIKSKKKKTELARLVKKHRDAHEKFLRAIQEHENIPKRTKQIVLSIHKTTHEGLRKAK